MKKVFVRKEDYDLYSIRVPFRMLTKRRRRGFIAGELEKIHPSSSVSSVEDTRLSIGRGGVFASVAVMDRERLSEYRGRAPKRRLFLEGVPRRAVFGGAGHGRRTLVLCMVALGAFALVKVCDALIADPEIPAFSEAIDKPATEGASAALLAPQELFAAVLASVRAKGGRVSNLSWGGGKCSFAVVGCSSDDIAGVSYCTVSYSSGSPQFNFSAPVNERKMAASAVIPVSSSDSGMIRSDFRNVANVVPFVREAVASSGSEVLSESVERNFSSVTFVSERAALGGTLSAVAEAARKCGWTEVSASVDCAVRSATTTVSFRNLGGQIPQFDTPLSVLSAHSDVFSVEDGERRSERAQRKFVIPETRRKVADGGSSGGLVKVGEIRRGNSSFVYYRGRDGKIFSEVKDVQ